MGTTAQLQKQRRMVRIMALSPVLTVVGVSAIWQKSRGRGLWTMVELCVEKHSPRLRPSLWSRF